MYHPKVIATQRQALERSLGQELREYSYGEVEEFAERLRNVDWVPNQSAEILHSLPEDIQRYVWNEIQMSKIDFKYWCERYAKILNDKGRVVPLRWWPSQAHFMKKIQEMELRAWNKWLEGKGGKEFAAKIPVILLKSRQIGGTVISEALLDHLVFFYKNTRAVIASDHPDNTLKLWQVALRMYDNLPGWMRPTRDAKVKATNLHLDGLDSDIIAGSGNQKTTLGQGMTVDAAHLTEVSSWTDENALAIDADLKPAFLSSGKHHSLLILESTGEGGRGNWFHDVFQSAQKGDSWFESLFIGWFMCPDKWALPSEGVDLTQETQDVGIRIERETGIPITKDQLAWYQMTRRDYQSRELLELFYQEYPSTVEEAFQTGFRSVFSIELRSRLRDKIRQPAGIYKVDQRSGKFIAEDVDQWVRSEKAEKWADRLIIWEAPRKDSVYIVGVDASYGLAYGDRGVIEVIRAGNRKLPDEQVAEWCGTISPFDLATVAEMVGKLYKDKVYDLPGKLAIECNPGSPGLVTQTELMRRGYPHFYVWKRPLRRDGGWSTEYGWWTTPHTRPLMVEMGVEYINKEYLLVNSPFAIAEMGTFVNTGIDRGRRHLEHAPGEHDDRLIAMFIALYVAHQDDVVSLADERLKLAERRSRPEAMVPWQATGMTWEQCMEEWEKNLDDR